MKKGKDYKALGDWKYRVTKGFSVQTDIIPPEKIQTNFSTLTVKGRLYIHKGFCWDGASGAFDTKNIMKASCLHDCLCNWMAAGLLSFDEYWEPADELLRKISINEGMSKGRARTIYMAVKEYGRIRYGIRY